jgi:hypothetical protein
MFGLDLIPTILGTLGVAILGALVAYWRGRASGESDANQDAMEDDYENAKDIRRRVNVDRAQRLRELDDAGFRD